TSTLPPCDTAKVPARDDAVTPTGGWSDPEQVAWYTDRIGKLEARRAGERMLLDMLPAGPRRVLDRRFVDGRISALVLEHRATVDVVVAIDISAPMLDLARQRFAGDERVEVKRGDLRDSISGFGAFDVIVSGFAIHHLTDERKQSLFAEA